MIYILYLIIFLYGIIIGSFLNVCIYRIPKQESIVVVRSHCMSCGYQLKWYDLVPLFSWIFLGGKCRKCGEKISVQYPLIEALNGGLYILIFAVCGWSIETLLYCLLASALIVLSVIDFRTYEIPVGINYFILALGLVRVITDYANWLDYGIGLLCVSMFLYLLILFSKGRAMGGGDMKLMAACGLLLGWKLIILAFVLGCIIGSIVHLTRMRVTHADHVLALGPYLAVGVMIAALWGEQMLQWYFALITI
jgi:leader peptidase (prepilin peptidase)/N-methyltransferase